MRTIEYASELDPLLAVSLPVDWIAAVVPEPGQLLADSELPEDRLLGQLLSGGDGDVVATRLQFLYHHGIDPDRDSVSSNRQVSVRYDVETGQYELSTGLAGTTVRTADDAIDWVDDQFLAVETFADTYRVLIDLADDVHGLGPTGVGGLVETFETLDAIRAADVEALAEVPHVDTENAAALQTALDERDGIDEADPTPLELAFRTHEGPLIFDRQAGPVSGELVPSGASDPKYVSEGVDLPRVDRDEGVIGDG